ncbi:MAG: hypothetical protein NVS2B14_05100 [Chamaesiphon sp.]
MNQEIIHKFVSLPGVVGVALINRQSQPYLYVKEETLDRQGKQVLIHSILKAIANNPEELDFLEFPIMGYYAYIYTLNSSLKLLVLNHTDIAAIKLLAAKQLKTTLQQDIDKTITIFELLTGKIIQAKVVSSSKGGYSTSSNSGNAPLEGKFTIEELLQSINYLSKFTSNYMGAKLVANYWQMTRPKFEWLNNFQIKPSGEITFSGAITEPISFLQHQWIKQWSTAFIKQCSQIMQDLPTMIEKNCSYEIRKDLY